MNILFILIRQSFSWYRCETTLTVHLKISIIIIVQFIKLNKILHPFGNFVFTKYVKLIWFINKCRNISRRQHSKLTLSKLPCLKELFKICLFNCIYNMKLVLFFRMVM